MPALGANPMRKKRDIKIISVRFSADLTGL